MREYRSHTCGELRAEHAGQAVILSGWVHSRRDHGGVIFIDLRDRYGITQLVCDPAQSADAWKVANDVRGEYVIRIEGDVRKRPDGENNKKLITGDVEILVTGCEVLSRSKTPPFEITYHSLGEADQNVHEDLRLEYRFLDLRRERLRDNVIKRHVMIKRIRDWFSARDFLEIQTPILANSSPEGARDYLVPSRLHKGKFYALPQAPQQFKQLLMVGGLDRYFQIAPCFRDEDPRADRSPGEFYQLDVEVSFMTPDSFFEMMEPLFVDLTENFAHKKVQQMPFPRIPYRQAMLEYGSDRPDLRFEMKITDLGEVIKNCEFKVFRDALDSGGAVRAICVKQFTEVSRSFIDNKLTPLVQAQGAKGLAYITYEDEPKSPILKYFTPEELNTITTAMGATKGDVIFFCADKDSVVCKALGELRLYLGKHLELIDKNLVAWAWIVDFPHYERNEETGKIDFCHNPFSMPQGGMEALMEKDPLDILAYQYDIIANGLELSSGAVRNADPAVFMKAFEIAGYSEEDVMRNFGHMVKAFEYGVPPHMGFAPGIDRMLMLFLDEPSIREVITFPKNGKCEDLVVNAPNTVSDMQLKELGIDILPQYKD